MQPFGRHVVASNVGSLTLWVIREVWRKDIHFFGEGRRAMLRKESNSPSGCPRLLITSVGLCFERVQLLVSLLQLPVTLMISSARMRWSISDVLEGVGDYRDGCRTPLPAAQSLCNFIYNAGRYSDTAVTADVLHKDTTSFAGCWASIAELRTLFFELQFLWCSNNFWLILNRFFQ